MPVVNIPNDGQIRSLGRINSTLHIYNPGPNGTTFDLTIINVGTWQNVPLAPGNTYSKQPAGNAVYIRNFGNNRLQALYAGAEAEIDAASLEVVPEFPAAEPATVG